MTNLPDVLMSASCKILVCGCKFAQTIAAHHHLAAASFLGSATYFLCCYTAAKFIAISADLAPNLGHFPPNPLPGKSARCVCKHITQNSPTGEQREKGAKTRAAHLLHVFAKLSPYTPAKPSIFPGYQSFFPTLCIFTHNVRYLSFELLASVSSNGSVSPSRPFKLTISENPSECLDPDTGLNHTLGVAWNIPGVCGQAHCELRNQQVYISYAL